MNVFGEEPRMTPLPEWATTAEVGDSLGGHVHSPSGPEAAGFHLEHLIADHVVHAPDLVAVAGAPHPVAADRLDACAARFDSNEQEYRAAGAIGDRAGEPPDAGLARRPGLVGTDASRETGR